MWSRGYRGQYKPEIGCSRFKKITRMGKGGISRPQERLANMLSSRVDGCFLQLQDSITPDHRQSYLIMPQQNGSAQDDRISLANTL
jgi:hypothetical protein